MNLSYKVKDKNIYLVCELDSDSMIDNFSFGMLKDNSVPGLIPFDSIEGKLVYNITSKTTLERILAKNIDEKNVINIVQGIIDTMCTLDEYMVDDKSVILDNEYIYVDLKENRADLVYIPLLNKTFNEGVDKYLIQLLEMVYSKYPEYSLVEYLIGQLKNNSTTTIEEIKNILNINQIQPKSEPGEEAVQQPVKDVELQEQFTQQSYTQVKQSMEAKQMPPMEELQKQPEVQQNLSAKIKPQPMEQKAESYTQSNQHQQPVMQNVQVDISQQSGMKKKMSLYYLLTHYSEENKKKYKEQKNKNHTTSESVQQNTDFNVQNAGTGLPQQDIKQERSENEIKSERIIAKQIIPNVQGNTELNYGDTMVLNESAATDSGETTILSDMVINTTVPYIIRTRTSERISILKSPFRISKENSSVDYFIADNTAISRNHAQIISENGRYYVIDNGSKNHTYVNGKMIPVETKVEIFPGNKIYFANEEFTFFII